jgi:hypothetical protein
MPDQLIALWVGTTAQARRWVRGFDRGVRELTMIRRSDSVDASIGSIFGGEDAGLSACFDARGRRTAATTKLMHTENIIRTNYA